jgi:hypothetical protein
MKEIGHLGIAEFVAGTHVETSTIKINEMFRELVEPDIDANEKELTEYFNSQGGDCCD